MKVEDIVVEDQDGVDNPIIEDKDNESVEDGKVGMVKIGDKEYSASEVEEWRKDSENKSNWQKEYTQKSQKLSEESKELERIKAMKNFLDDPDNKDKAEKIQRIARGELEELPPEDEFESDETKALREKLTALESQVKNIQDNSKQQTLTNIQREIDNEKKQVKVDFPALDEEEIDMIEAMTIKAQNSSDDIVKISDIAKKYVEASNKRKEGIIKSYLNSKEEDANNFTEHGSMPAPQKGRKISLDDDSAQKEFAKTLKGLTAD